MRMITFKAKPKNIFGIAIVLIGLIVIISTFLFNHNGAAPSSASKDINCKTKNDRISYITSLGWETDGNEESREIVIPQEFNNVYNDYNKVQIKQGFNLENYKSKTATIYTYSITNYNDNNNVIADLIVIDGKLIGADMCDTNVETGFLIELKSKS